jgi:hypothetical protein
VADFILTIKVRSTGDNSKVLADQEAFIDPENAEAQATSIVRDAMTADAKSPARVAMRVSVRPVGTSRGLYLKRMCGPDKAASIAGEMAKSIIDQIKKIPPEVDFMSIGADAFDKATTAVDGLKSVAAWAKPAVAAAAAVASPGGVAAAETPDLGGLISGLLPQGLSFLKKNPGLVKQMAAIGEQVAGALGGGVMEDAD